MNEDTTILIAGAGPTGLVMGLTLSRLGVPFRIVDPKPGPTDQSRALGIQARTLEFYRILGFADEVVELGIPVRSVHVVEGGDEKTAFSLSDMGQGISPYPYLLVFAQDAHERFLLEQLEMAGHEVEWHKGVRDFTESSDAVQVTLEGQARIEEVRCAWLIGCDGAHSAVRKGLDIGFPSGTNEGLFFVADVLTDRPSEDVFAAFADDTVSLMFPVRRSSGAQRLLGIMPPEMENRSDLTFEDVRRLSERNLGLNVQDVNWFSTYHVSHRVAETFRKGRSFLAGDAGHIHSPVGGQAMNTGIGDAFNLAWKLAAVIKGEARHDILDTYSPERMAFAQKLRPRATMHQRSKFLRTVVLPNALRILTPAPGIPQMIFRTISQTRITYRDTAFSEGRAGDIRGGDRLPWVEVLDNFKPLEAFCWQLHVYGETDASLADAARGHGLKLVNFEFHEDAAEAGLAKNGAYLVRPDGHVGLALPTQDAAKLTNYLESHGLLQERRDVQR